MLDQLAERARIKYDLQWDDYIISYTFDWEKWFWLKVWNNFEEVSEKLLKCNQDVKEIKAKINRMLWISETMVGKWIWITKRKMDLLQMILIIEFQMYMINWAVFKFNKKLHKRLQEDDLTSKLYEDGEWDNW